ncbi:hypothetical protein [Sediminispirochaeta bajacaliforniensis]|uniref:hypothetical protein n=1 Tax=Sediminispirochaeta bajacaliforniensis TaxID=148 RepID=UPI000365EDB0|nr:hypothetical protein [Sediminispirochaeta bajacaliforniensis]
MSYPDITISKMCPLIIQDADYCRQYGCATLERGGRIEILVDCSFGIKKLVKEDDGEVNDNPDIILKGFDGSIGSPGQSGEDGGAGAKAEIIIDDLQSSLNVHVYGGGSGGQGGRGGDGGSGGDGAYGADGGDGGDGGDGACGGTGGSGGELIIKYKTSNASKITGKELSSCGGEAGRAGSGGAGGHGEHDGRTGRKGRKGENGQDGGRGKLTIIKTKEEA